MSVAGDGDVAATMAVEQPAAEIVTAEGRRRQSEKTLKESKPKEKKSKSAKASNPSHPPYFQMIKEALVALHDKRGSSPYAIAKYMEQNHKAVLPANYKKMLALQLKNFAAKGKLIKIKASYKLAELDKEEKGLTRKGTKASTGKAPKSGDLAAPKVRKPRKASTPKKAANPAKKMGVKKTKKATPAKPKQPKSIKSPATKKAKKAMA